MKPEDIPAEWVERAARAVVDELGACAMCGESGPAGCVYCKDDAEQHARAALAAVLPLAERARSPFLVEWAAEVDDIGTKEIYDTEEEARTEARRSGLRLFRIEWTEVDA
jgi:hypothetical protein